MCCEPTAIGRAAPAWAYDCCCCSPERSLFPRRFVSRKEELETLQEYSDQLKKELAGVAERIEEIKKK